MDYHQGSQGSEPILIGHVNVSNSDRDSLYPPFSPDTSLAPFHEDEEDESQSVSLSEAFSDSEDESIDDDPVAGVSKHALYIFLSRIKVSHL